MSATAQNLYHSSAALIHPSLRCSANYFPHIGPRCPHCAILRRSNGRDGPDEGRIRPRWKEYVCIPQFLVKYTANHCRPVMMIGIITQLVATVIFALVAADFIWRICTDRPARSTAPGSSDTIIQGQREGYVRITQPMRLLLIGMGISTFLVVIRFAVLFDVPKISLTSPCVDRSTERSNSQTAGTVRSSPQSGTSTSSMPLPSFSLWLQSIFSTQGGS